jgi:large subunit ribosomal protein L21
MKYAVVVDGSRQYRVSEGDIFLIDYRDGVEAGARLELSKLILLRDGEELLVGQPGLDGARVVADVLGEHSKKVMIQKYRRRKNYKRLRGHRQWYTRVKVRHILRAGQDIPAEPTPPAPAPAAEGSTPATA